MSPQYPHIPYRMKPTLLLQQTPCPSWAPACRLFSARPRPPHLYSSSPSRAAGSGQLGNKTWELKTWPLSLSWMMCGKSLSFFPSQKMKVAFVPTSQGRVKCINT